MRMILGMIIIIHPEFAGSTDLIMVGIITIRSIQIITGILMIPSTGV